MIHLKTKQEIEYMKEGGKMLRSVLDYLFQQLHVGITTLELDNLAEKKIKSLGGESSFKKVPNYNWTCCFSINEDVVHGIPTDYRIQKGDVIGIDCGVYYEGLHTDSARTVLFEDKNPNITKFLKTGESTLEIALSEVKVGNHIGHISKTIQSHIEEAGYSIVKNLTGHGVGRNLHESPEIPGILKGSIEKTPLIKIGMVLAVEIIYNLGSPDVMYKKDDGWTISTRDGKISGLFEKTVAVGADGVFVLT